MPYGAVLYVFMLTAFAVLSSKYLCLHWYLDYVCYDSPDTPIHELQDFLRVNFYTHNKNTSDYLDTSLVLLQHHFHTTLPYTKAYQKTYSTIQNQYAVPIYYRGEESEADSFSPR